MPPVALANERRASPLDRLYRYLERLAGSEFYGKVVVSFQNAQKKRAAAG